MLKEKESSKSALPPSMQKLIHAETEYRFMLQLVFRKNYEPTMKDKQTQMDFLHWSVVHRLTDMEQNIIQLRKNAFGNNQQ